MALRDTLQSLLDASRETGTEKEVRLIRGLVVCVRSNSKQTRLILRRRDSLPSHHEWRTVIDFWPEPCPKVDPEEREVNGKRVLYAVWPTPQKLIEVAPVTNRVVSAADDR